MGPLVSSEAGDQYEMPIFATRTGSSVGRDKISSSRQRMLITLVMTLLLSSLLQNDRAKVALM